MNFNKKYEYNGKIIFWNPDKNFGFVRERKTGKRIFFHRSKLSTDITYQPQQGDKVSFYIGQDAEQRLYAFDLIVEGIDSYKIKPKKRNILDFIFILITVATLIYLASLYFYDKDYYLKTNTYILCIPGIIAFLLLGRNKKPKNTHFVCASCYNKSKFNSRTIRAWNRGKNKFYCNDCYTPQNDHDDCYTPQNHHDSRFTPSHSSHGCLSCFILVFLIPPLMIFLS